MHRSISAARRLLLPFVLLLTAAGCSGPPAAPAADRIPEEPLPDGVVRIPAASLPFIAVQPVSVEQGEAVLTAPAHVAFQDGALAEVGAPLAGRVTQVHVRTGDTVKPGQPLVTLDCPEAAAVRAAVKTARVSLHEARLARDRERRMLEQGVGTERDTLAAETQVAELEAELARAEAAAASVGDESGTTVVLRAPIAGEVISRKATDGMAVQSGGDALVEVGDPADLWIVGDVFERDLPAVRDGARATVEFPSMQGELAGRVVSVGAVVTSGLRTAPVRVALDADAGVLRPGMYGRLRLDGAAVGGPTLPSEAVLIKGKDSVVYVEQAPLTYARRTVTVGRPIDGKVHVLSGLTADDKVVVHGALFLDGAADQLI
jgi:cobalt-zinc-cadmium efflux system membrane fusion protein